MKKYINIEKAPKAIGPYSQAVKVNNMMFLSGQLGIDYQTNEIGKDIKNQTELVLKNINEILLSENFSKDDVVKTTIFLTDLNDFNLVNQIYEKYFEMIKPARSTVQVGKLPKNALIEIELIAFKE